MEEIAFCGGALWDLKVEPRAAAAAAAAEVAVALDTHAALFRDFLKQDGIYLDSPHASDHKTSSDYSVEKAKGEIKATPPQQTALTFHANIPSDTQQGAPRTPMETDDSASPRTQQVMGLPLPHKFSLSSLGINSKIVGRKKAACGVLNLLSTKSKQLPVK